MRAPIKRPGLLARPAECPPGAPFLQPLILTASIALISVVPIAVGAAAVLWALAGLAGAPRQLLIGGDAVLALLVAAGALPLLLRVFWHERALAAAERTVRRP